MLDKLNMHEKKRKKYKNEMLGDASYKIGVRKENKTNWALKR